jgi:cytochrome P450
MNDPNNEIAIRAKQIFKTLIDSFSLTGHLFLDKSCFDYISKLTMDLVAERRKENLSSDGVKGRSDFLQVLVDAKYENKLTDDQICGFGMSFFSDEGTSTTLTALAYFLAKNPDVQNKLHEEVQQIQNEVNFDTVASLTYLDAVIKETLRMWPSGYRLDRVAAENYKLEGTNITIPAGMTVQLPTYAFQHDPKIYSEPNKFKPERFIVHSEFNPIPPPFYGFGAGPRTCIAQRLATLNLKLTVVKLVNHFWFESTPETKLECLEGQQILVFTKDVYLKLVPR